MGWLVKVKHKLMHLKNYQRQTEDIWFTHSQLSEMFKRSQTRHIFSIKYFFICMSCFSSARCGWTNATNVSLHDHLSFQRIRDKCWRQCKVKSVWWKRVILKLIWDSNYQDCGPFSNYCLETTCKDGAWARIACSVHPHSNRLINQKQLMY